MLTSGYQLPKPTPMQNLTDSSSQIIWTFDLQSAFHCCISTDLLVCRESNVSESTVKVCSRFWAAVCTTWSSSSSKSLSSRRTASSACDWKHKWDPSIVTLLKGLAWWKYHQDKLPFSAMVWFLWLMEKKGMRTSLSGEASFPTLPLFYFFFFF